MVRLDSRKARRGESHGCQPTKPTSTRPLFPLTR
jgi:hypothetical protein